MLRSFSQSWLLVLFLYAHVSVFVTSSFTLPSGEGDTGGVLHGVNEQCANPIETLRTTLTVEGASPLTGL